MSQGRSDKREERERRRKERLETQRAQDRSERLRKIAGYGVAGLLSAAVLGGLVAAVVFGGDNGVAGADRAYILDDPAQVGQVSTEGAEADNREGTEPPEQRIDGLEDAAEAAGCDLRTDLDDEGATHVQEGVEVDYQTSPPTSGDHYPAPYADGAFLNTPPSERFVHTLEHGRVLIQYHPDLPESEQLLLKGVFEEDPGAMMLFPFEDMPYQVAVTAWRQQLVCEEWSPETVDAVRAFRDEFRGMGPERLPIPDHDT